MLGAVLRTVKAAATAAILLKVASETSRAVDAAWDRLKERRA